MRELPTIGSRNGLFYYGDREGWYVVAGQNWDSRRQDRDTLAYAIRNWRQYRHRAVGKA